MTPSPTATHIFLAIWIRDKTAFSVSVEENGLYCNSCETASDPPHLPSISRILQNFS
jgi:hypothetical protein